MKWNNKTGNQHFNSACCFPIFLGNEHSLTNYNLIALQINHNFFTNKPQFFTLMILVNINF